ncbi:hypothetical protein ACFL1S_01860 [Pseudomonadota bacterium]
MLISHGAAMPYAGSEQLLFRVPLQSPKKAFALQNFGKYEATAAENLAYEDWESVLDDRDALYALAERIDTAELVEAVPE